VIDIATGEVEDRPPTPEEQGKDPACGGPGQQGRRGTRQDHDRREARRDRAQGRPEALETLLTEFRESIFNIRPYTGVLIVSHAALDPLGAHRMP